VGREREFCTRGACPPTGAGALVAARCGWVGGRRALHRRELLGRAQCRARGPRRLRLRRCRLQLSSALGRGMRMRSGLDAMPSAGPGAHGARHGLPLRHTACLSCLSDTSPRQLDSHGVPSPAPRPCPHPRLADVGGCPPRRCITMPPSDTQSHRRADSGCPRSTDLNTSEADATETTSFSFDSQVSTLI
jgi:hypothetical protein